MGKKEITPLQIKLRLNSGQFIEAFNLLKEKRLQVYKAAEDEIEAEDIFTEFINLADSEGETLLFYACRAFAHDMVEWLIGEGAYVIHRDQNGFTALQLLSAADESIARYPKLMRLHETTKQLIQNAMVQHFRSNGGERSDRELYFMPNGEFFYEVTSSEDDEGSLGEDFELAYDVIPLPDPVAPTKGRIPVHDANPPQNEDASQTTTSSETSVSEGDFDTRRVHAHPPRFFSLDGRY